MGKKEFLDEVCAQIRAKRIHSEIRDELSAHIDELTENFCRKDGMNAIDAEARAVAAMGDSCEIGSALNRRHRPQTDFVLLGLVMLAVVIGAVGMYFCGGTQLGASFNGYIVSAIIGIIVFFAVFFCDYSRLYRLSLPIYLFASAWLMYIVRFGTPFNGASRFFRLGAIAVSADITIPLLILGFGGVCARCRGRGMLGLLALIGLGTIPVLITMFMPYFRLTMLLMICFGAVLMTAAAKGFFGGSKHAQVGLLSAIVLAGGAIFVILILGRIAKSDINGAGYPAAVADFWLKNSAMFGTSTASFHGVGIGESLPSAASEYIFVTLVATFGKAAGTAIVVIAALMSAKMLTAASKIRDGFGFMLSIAAAAALIWQFVCGILSNLGIAPVLYYGIPFLSYGGTGYVVNMALAGFILSARRHATVIPTIQCRKKHISIEDKKLIVDFSD